MFKTGLFLYAEVEKESPGNCQAVATPHVDFLMKLKRFVGQTIGTGANIYSCAWSRSCLSYRARVEGFIDKPRLSGLTSADHAFLLILQSIIQRTIFGTSCAWFECVMLNSILRSGVCAFWPDDRPEGLTPANRQRRSVSQSRDCRSLSYCSYPMVVESTFRILRFMSRISLNCLFMCRLSLLQMIIS